MSQTNDLNSKFASRQRTFSFIEFDIEFCACRLSGLEIEMVLLNGFTSVQVRFHKKPVPYFRFYRRTGSARLSSTQKPKPNWNRTAVKVFKGKKLTSRSLFDRVPFQKDFHIFRPSKMDVCTNDLRLKEAPAKVVLERFLILVMIFMIWIAVATSRSDCVNATCTATKSRATA